jgi:histidinol-phosphatase
VTGGEPDWSDDLALALRLAGRAASVALAYFGDPLGAESKEDGTPVTVADFAVEAELVDLLRQERPEDGVLSEEGAFRANPERQWILDPIDGTVNFAVADPNWGTHVALEVDATVVVGVITRPVARRRWWASLGGGAFTDEEGQSAQPLRTSTVDNLEEARITLWPPEPSRLLDALRSAGVFVEPDWNVMAQLLAGNLDAIIARGGGVWDHAPAVILTEEAGGRYRDPEGGRRLDLHGGIYSNSSIDSSMAALLEV